MVIAPAIQVERQKVCQKCEFWRGRCTKFHISTSPAGCPVGKFPALNVANGAYNVPSPSGCRGNCGQTGDVKELSYSQVVSQLRMEMVLWTASKMPLASQVEYQRRLSACGKCPNYKWFQCKLCKCVMVVKARLGTSKCPDSPPRW